MDQFVTTRWSLVVDAQTEHAPHGQQALGALCELYWYPLYAYLRRRGHSRDDAQDLTQGFFAYLLEHHTLQRVDKQRGRFRSFLLASLNHYVANAGDWDRAQKRGGTVPHVSLDPDAAEARYRCEPVDRWTPEKAFDRSWALTVLDHVLRRVQRECEATGKGDVFDQLKGCLTGDPFDAPYRELGRPLAMTEGAVKQAVHRLRHAFRERLYAEIASTVSTPEDIDAELTYLMSALTA
jgi:DNA-directed RNA polymerase specialized sigma24 family protein